MISKSAIVLCLAIGAVVAVDYCKDMRCAKKPHVACNSPAANKGWGPACSPDRALVKITPELRQKILDIHNKQRNQQAAGKTPNYGPAARMGTLVWDDGLAEMAEYNVRLCKYGHDKCRNTEKWYPAGQNIAQGGNYVEDNEIIDKLVPAWFDMEHANGKYYGWMDMINNFQGIGGSDPNAEVGHFTQIVWQDAVVVGCAGSKYTDSNGKEAVLVCNYGFGNMQGNYVYEAGPTASKCKTGTNPDYPALCSVDEDYTDERMKRSAWDLKPIPKANGFSYNLPGGCDDDPECRKMKANPSAYFKSKGYLKPKPQDTEPKVTVGSDGKAHFSFPSGCDKACQDKAISDFKAKHPEYSG